MRKGPPALPKKMYQGQTGARIAGTEKILPAQLVVLALEFTKPELERDEKDIPEPIPADPPFLSCSSRWPGFRPNGDLSCRRKPEPSSSISESLMHAATRHPGKNSSQGPPWTTSP